MSAWKAFQLVPDDVLFFRDGKPSTRGADHYLRSLFPPHPSTLYGAVRTRRLLDAGVELTGLDAATWPHRLGNLVDELGEWGQFGTLELRGPWLVHSEKGLLLPAPHDLGVVIQKKKTGPAENEPPRAEKVVRYRPAEPPQPQASGGWSHRLALMFPCEKDGSRWQGGPGTEPRSAVGWFLTPPGLAAWRRGGVPEPGDLLHSQALWLDEARTGVGLQGTWRYSAEGMLYTFGFIRLERGVSLGFEVKESGLKAEGRVRLGGEGRTAVLTDGPAFPPVESLPAGGLISLCFATPALSKNGGYPPGFAPEAGSSDGVVRGTLGERRLRLVAAAVQGYVTVGGWDVAKNYPKPLRRALPAGSVFLFEPEDGATPLDFDGQCFSEFENDRLWRQGFGLAVAGVGGILGQQDL